MIFTMTFKSAVGFTALLALFTILPGAASQVKAAESQVQLTKKQVKALAATAMTSEDHMQLSRYFSREADRLEAESRQHEQLANEYRRSPISQAMAMKNPMGPRTAAHCDFFAKATHEAALKSRALVADHQQMAMEAVR